MIDWKNTLVIAKTDKEIISITYKELLHISKNMTGTSTEKKMYKEYDQKIYIYMTRHFTIEESQSLQSIF